MIVTLTTGFECRMIIAISTEDPPGNPGPPTSHFGTSMTLWSVDASSRAQVAGAIDLPIAGTVVVDVAVPIGRPVWYELVGSTGVVMRSATTETVVPPRFGDLGPACLVTNPITGAIVPVAIVSWPSLSRTVQGQETTIPGRAEVLLDVGVEMLPTSSPTLLTLTPEAAKALTELLASGEIVLLRTPDPNYPDEFLSVRGRSTERFTRRSPARLHQIDSTHHTHPSLDLMGLGDTLGVLHDVMPGTLGDIAARWDRLFEIAAANLLGEGSGA